MSEGSALTPEPLPQLNEAELVARRLDELTEESLRGEHTGTPVRFFAAIERERVFVTTENVEEMLQDPDGSKAKGVGKIPESFRPLAPEAKDVILAEFHRDAAAEIAALVPSNPSEELKKQRWLEALPGFNDIRDVIGFRLCQEFSTPTLKLSTPAAEVTCEELASAEEENAKTRNWIEYRFGNSPREGWYDAPGVNETQLTPCAPSEAAHRQDIIERRIAELETELGCFTVAGGSQWNLSAYERVPLPRPKVEFEDDNGRLTKAKVRVTGNRALIGTLDGREETTLDTLAGTLAGISDGAWMNADEVRMGLFDDGNSGYRAYRAASSKKRGVQIRVGENRYELRSGFFDLSTRQNFLWMMSGILDGLHNGQRLLEERNIPSPWVKYDTKLTLGEDATESSLLLASVLSLYDASPDGGGVLQFKKDESQSEKSDSARMLEDVILPSIRVARRGTLYTSKRAIDAVRAQAIRQGIGNLDLSEEFLEPYITAITAGLQFVPQRKIEGVVYFDHLPSRERFRAMLGSSAMRIAFGNDHPEYVKYLEAEYKKSQAK